jgi:site-specific DNA-methyltransferase (adenine-specific)
MSEAAAQRPSKPRARRGTTTARFGSGRRESHDASIFYERFTAPEISGDSTVERASQLDVIHRHDARDMAVVESNSVALVVTSPPYFAGKAYEESLGENGVPANYFEYLTMLGDVFAECKRVLEPGGRIAVNVANLGRKPYRSLAGDVTDILSDLGLLLRGEVVWWKGRAAGGSCAWGTFQRPGNPVLRDVTERIVVASKGRFDRALSARQRAAAGLPSDATISREDCMGWTADLWEIAPESATRVDHPAPFPVQLPLRLIDLYTYADDVVLDPFMGSGSTAVAAVRTGRHFIGFDTDADYVGRAEARIALERTAAEAGDAARSVRIEANEVDSVEGGELDAFSHARREGRQVKDVARALLEACGFRDVKTDVKQPRLGVEVTFTAVDQLGGAWVFDVSGAFTNGYSGLRRADVLWKALAKASVLLVAGDERPVVLLTTDVPARSSSGATALASVVGDGKPVFDVVTVDDVEARERLRGYATDGPTPSR